MLQMLLKINPLSILPRIKYAKLVVELRTMDIGVTKSLPSVIYTFVRKMMPTLRVTK